MVYIAVYIIIFIFSLYTNVNFSKGSNFSIDSSAYISIIFYFRNSIFTEMDT